MNCLNAIQTTEEEQTPPINETEPPSYPGPLTIPINIKNLG